jgi:hypothetical protein
MNEGNRRSNARAESVLGDDALQAARHLLALGLHNDAVSRAYYAAFHFVRALLLTEGGEPRTHRGVVALLERDFVATGRIEPDVAARLARLQTFRGLADYDARERVSARRAREEVAAAEAVVDAVRKVLRDGGIIE